MNDSTATLYYIHDPMCSWCWGFRATWSQVLDALSGKVNVRYVLGGLAADSDQPMSESMQQSIRSNWQRIQQDIPGTEFNYDFWSQCQPRRSTYPACRAVIAAGMQAAQAESKMLFAVQQAYYLLAKNPSDLDVLIQIARDIGLDGEAFAADINSEACIAALDKDLLLSRDLYVSSFPSLLLSHDNVLSNIQIDYTSSANILNQIFQNLNDCSRLSGT